MGSAPKPFFSISNALGSLNVTKKNKNVFYISKYSAIMYLYNIEEHMLRKDRRKKNGKE